MQGLIQMSRDNPELAIFPMLALGFRLCHARIGSSSRGVVTSALLAPGSNHRPF